MKNLYIHATTQPNGSSQVHLVRQDGAKVALIYQGYSHYQKCAVIKRWRKMGYDGWNNPALMSTSGGNGDSVYFSNIGRWDNIGRYGKSINLRTR